VCINSGKKLILTLINEVTYIKSIKEILPEDCYATGGSKPVKVFCNYWNEYFNKEKLALGKPLAIAHELEQKEAIYPRILISRKFNEVFDDFTPETAEHRFNDLLILQSCEKYYLNIFIHVLKTDRKLEFLTIMQKAIIQNLDLDKESEHK
jgi:hypothetical protein